MEISTKFINQLKLVQSVKLTLTIQLFFYFLYFEHIEHVNPIAWNNSRKILKSMKSVDRSENALNQTTGQQRQLAIPPDNRQSSYGKSIKC